MPSPRIVAQIRPPFITSFIARSSSGAEVTQSFMKEHAAGKNENQKMNERKKKLYRKRKERKKKMKDKIRRHKVVGKKFTPRKTSQKKASP